MHLEVRGQCVLFLYHVGPGPTLGSEEALREETLSTGSILLVPRGGVLALGNQVHEEVQEGASGLPSVLQLLLA